MRSACDGRREERGRTGWDPGCLTLEGVPRFKAFRPGLLTRGQSTALRLPTRIRFTLPSFAGERWRGSRRQWRVKGFVPDYSGGAMPDLHRLPKGRNASIV
jgi:hypothetical protein